jgi:acyl carrier protein
MNDKTPERLRQVVIDALAKVAPEADASTLDPKQGLRDQLDLDSMDFLNFVLALHAALGVDVPERDYPKLATLDSCVDYLARTTTRA